MASGRGRHGLRVIQIIAQLFKYSSSVPRVTRPAKFLKTHYNEASKVIYQGVNQILNGTPAKNVLPGMQSKLNQIIK